MDAVIKEPGLGILNHDGGLRGKALRIAANGPDVCMARYRPKTIPIGRFVPVAGGVLSEPAVLVLGMACSKASRTQQVDLHGIS